MASLFEKVPDDLANMGRQVQGLSWGNVLLYCLIAIVIVLIVSMLLGKKASWFFSWIDFRSAKSKALSGSKTFWKSESAGPKVNDGTRGNQGRMHDMIIPEDQMPEPPANTQYTYHVDVLLANSRNLSGIDGPYRHILHRGSDELYSGDANTPVATGAVNLPPAGLPERMNPGIFLDPNTNDILIFVDTKGRQGETYRESVRLADIPLEKPFRLSVSVFGNVLEVNINCNLEITKVLSGTPRPVENVIYGLCGPAAAQASIQDLILWPFAINSQQLLALCPKKFPAFAPAVPSSCAASKNLINLTTKTPTGGKTSPYTFTCSTK